MTTEPFARCLISRPIQLYPAKQHRENQMCRFELLGSFILLVQAIVDVVKQWKINNRYDLNHSLQLDNL